MLNDNYKELNNCESINFLVAAYTNNILYKHIVNKQNNELITEEMVKNSKPIKQNYDNIFLNDGKTFDINLLLNKYENQDIFIEANKDLKVCNIFDY